jgi:hypothetical protein
VLLKASQKDASETKCTYLLKVEAFNILKVKKKSKEIGINAVGAGWRLQVNTNRPCHPSEYPWCLPLRTLAHAIPPYFCSHRNSK